MYYIFSIFFIVLVILAAWLLNKSLRSASEGKIEKSKNIAEILAITAAGFFFLFRIFDGWMGISMSVNMKAERIVNEEKKNEDIIAVQVELEKGEIGNMYLYDAEIRAIFPDETDPEKMKGPKTKLLGIHRLEEEGGIIQSDRKSTKYYRINPKDRLQFANYLRVPHNKPCVIEFTVVGWRIFAIGGYPQWRSSMVSLPRYDKKEPDDKQ